LPSSSSIFLRQSEMSIAVSYQLSALSQIIA